MKGKKMPMPMKGKMPMHTMPDGYTMKDSEMPMKGKMPMKKGKKGK